MLRKMYEEKPSNYKNNLLFYVTHFNIKNNGFIKKYIL